MSFDRAHSQTTNALARQACRWRCRMVAAAITLAALAFAGCDVGRAPAALDADLDDPIEIETIDSDIVVHLTATEYLPDSDVLIGTHGGRVRSVLEK